MRPHAIMNMSNEKRHKPQSKRKAGHMEIIMHGEGDERFDMLEFIRHNTAADVEPLDTEEIHAALSLEIGDDLALGLFVIKRVS